MGEARHFCPDCGSIDIEIINRDLRDDKGNSLGRAECPNCGWKGALTQTIGAVSTEQFWDAERVGEVMMRTMAIHAAGPLVQCLEFIGLLPRKRYKPEDKLDHHVNEESKKKYEAELALFNDPSTEKWNAAAQRARDAVMRRIMEAAITAGFEEAERVNRLFAIETETDIHPMLKQEEEVREFGGDVGEKKITNIKEARRKKRK